MRRLFFDRPQAEWECEHNPWPENRPDCEACTLEDMDAVEDDWWYRTNPPSWERLHPRFQEVA